MTRLWERELEEWKQRAKDAEALAERRLATIRHVQDNAQAMQRSDMGFRAERDRYKAVLERIGSSPGHWGKVAREALQGDGG